MGKAVPRPSRQEENKTETAVRINFIGRHSAPAATPFDGKGTELYQVMARTALPAGATNILLLETIPNGIVINDWESLQLVYSYESYGLSYRRAIAFLNLRAREQLVFDVSALANDFDKIYRRAYRVLNCSSSSAAIPARRSLHRRHGAGTPRVVAMPGLAVNDSDSKTERVRKRGLNGAASANG